MSLQELAVPSRVTGERQVRRYLQRGELLKLFIADDADSGIVSQILAEAQEKSIPVERVASMVLLGRACAISRGASVAGIRKERVNRQRET